MEAPFLQGTPFYEGSALSSSGGSVITANAAAHTKGSYTELIAATSFPYSGFFLHIDAGQTGAAFCAIDIAIGAAASEIDILKNFLCGWGASTHEASHVIFIPLKIAAGVRVACRMQSTVGSRTLRVCFTGVGMGARIMPGFDMCDTIGVDTATTRGINIEPGAVANTKGAYSQITASTVEKAKALILATCTASSQSNTRRALDLAFGAGGSEIIMIPNIRFCGLQNGDCYTPGFQGPYPMNINPGTRIAARMSSSTTSAVERVADAAIYCFR